MMIPLSSHRVRRKAQSSTRNAIGASRVQYMNTALAYQLLPDDDGDGLRDGKMGFLEHLDELRVRIIRSCIAVAVGMIVAFAFIDRIVTFVLAPSRRMLPPGARLIYTEPGEAFGLYIQVALIAGVLLAAPLIMVQVWRFIAPGLYAKEKKFAIPFVLLTTVGTLAGAGFSHYILFPYLIAFFGTFNSPDLAFMPRLEDVFDLYTKMLLGMCVVFQILYAVLIIFIVAAVLTPTADPWNQTIFAAPMVGLYLISILIVWLVQPKRHQSSADSAVDE